MEQNERLMERGISSEEIYDGQVVHLFVDRVALPDGKEAIREYVKHIGAVAVLPLTAEREVVCVKQYRYAHGRVLCEIPAGKLDSPTEDRRAAALRELREETGIRPSSLTYLGPFLSTPAILNEVVELYLAEGLTFGDTDPDEDEWLDVERVPLSTLVDAILAGDRTMDGKTQLAVLMVNELLRRRDGAMEEKQ